MPRLQSQAVRVMKEPTEYQRARAEYKQLEDIVIKDLTSRGIKMHKDFRSKAVVDPKNIAYEIAWLIYDALAHQDETSRAGYINCSGNPKYEIAKDAMQRLGLCNINNRVTGEAIRLYNALRVWYDADEVL